MTLITFCQDDVDFSLNNLISNTAWAFLIRINMRTMANVSVVGYGERKKLNVIMQNI
jgi:hypothetical protein